ncbi:Bax inhibitor-1/YccA family protein [Lentisphaerota bacterium ZTH]|nr:Bax inhibitor-1/YccA family protein [Lentisphaerota bacterium]WET07746.1 Bax inhibitor-1/YccA family protein [Lentisphaerota bacterium ZTH]
MNQGSRSAMSTMAQSRVVIGYINRVYGWMCGGLALTALIAYFGAQSPTLVKLLRANPVILIGIIVAELVLVGVLSFGQRKLNYAASLLCFLGYAALNGILFSMIFLVYTGGSIASTFFVTSGTFGAMSLYGYVTKRDLTTIGNICFMALIGLIIASVVNIFIASSALYWIVTYAGILIFVGLIAYDTQKIKQMAMAMGNDLAETDTGKKYAIMGALTLYLDFINLFILLLRIFGRGRD